MRVNDLYSGLEQFAYVCKNGEGIADISARFCVPVSRLKELNNIESDVRCGQEIFIVRHKCRSYRVKPGDTVDSICDSIGVAVELADGMDCLKNIYPGKMIYIEIN